MTPSPRGTDAVGCYVYLETSDALWLSLHRTRRCPLCGSRVAEMVGRGGTGFVGYGDEPHCGVIWYAHEL